MEFRIRADDIMEIRADDFMEFLTKGIIHATLKKNNQDKRVVKILLQYIKKAMKRRVILLTTRKAYFLF